ncbi:MAG: hypothetical protein DRN15_04045 [Thermoprotei archaeon]|nr:MAG: hypothetical protein DRN15_04045 [Thermoprotei archaeon]
MHNREVERIIETAERICRLGEVVAGDDKEEKVLEIIRATAERSDFSLELKPVHVMSWREKFSSLEVWYDSHKLDIPCLALPYSPSGVVEAPLIFVGTGTEKDYEKVVVEDKIALVEWYKEELDDVKIQYLKACEHGAAAVVVYDAYEGGKLRRIVVTGVYDYRFTQALPPPVPIVSIAREDGLRLVDMLRKGIELKARLEVHTEVRHDAVGYNAIMRIGDGEEKVIVSAHHDHWLEGAVDNCLGLALLLWLMREKWHDLRRELWLVSFTAEESGAPNYAPWYWAYGSRMFLKDLKELIDEILVNINVDVVYGHRVGIDAAGPELVKAVERILGMRNLSHIVYYCEPMLHYYDSFSFLREGISTITLTGLPHFMSLYHTNQDKIGVVNYDMVRAYASVLKVLVKSFCSADADLCYEWLMKTLRAMALNMGHDKLLKRILSINHPSRYSLESLRRFRRRVNTQLIRLVCEGDYSSFDSEFKLCMVPLYLIVKDYRKLLRALRSLEMEAKDKALKILESIPPARTFPGEEVPYIAFNVKGIRDMIVKGRIHEAKEELKRVVDKAKGVIHSELQKLDEQMYIIIRETLSE